MSVRKTHIIFNPTAGCGRAAHLMPRLLPEIDRRFGPDYILHVTHGASDATRFARKASEEGARLIIAAGGDGTVHEVINGMFRDRSPVNPHCTLGILDFGTGKGLAQTLALPYSHHVQLNLIANAPESPIDIGFISYHDIHGQPCEDLFISECQIGIGSVVAQKVHTGFKKLGGTMAFGIVAMAQAIGYRPNDVTFQFDDAAAASEKLIGLVIGNGKYCAGGMKLTPDARNNDGFFDILRIHDMSIPERLLSFPKIYTGNHVHSSHFTLSQGTKLKISSDEAMLIEADGEVIGWLPCEIGILPAMLNLKFKTLNYGNHE